MHGHKVESLASLLRPFGCSGAKVKLSFLPGPACRHDDARAAAVSGVVANRLGRNTAAGCPVAEGRDPENNDRDAGRISRGPKCQGYSSEIQGWTSKCQFESCFGAIHTNMTNTQFYYIFLDKVYGEACDNAKNTDKCATVRSLGEGSAACLVAAPGEHVST